MTPRHPVNEPGRVLSNWAPPEPPAPGFETFHDLVSAGPAPRARPRKGSRWNALLKPFFFIH